MIKILFVCHGKSTVKTAKFGTSGQTWAYRGKQIILGLR